MTAVPPRPAAPDATAGDELRGDCRGCGSRVDDYRAHVYGERKCCPECDHRPLPALRDVLAERPKLDALLHEAGIDYPTGLRGVSDLIDQRDGEQQRAEEAEAERDRLRATVQRVEALRAVWTREGSQVVPYSNLRRALDGTE